MTPGPGSDAHADAPTGAGGLSARTELLPSGADASGPVADGFPPLMVAAGMGDAREVESLLAAGADALAVEPVMGATALHKAAQAGSAAVLGLLLDHGAFIDQQSPVLGNTPLIDAVLHKHEDAVRLLLVREARTRIRNHWQQSALELARHDGLDAIAGLIETRDPNDAEQVRGLTLFAHNSSRRSPGTRRGPGKASIPACMGLSRSRRARRKAPSAVRSAMPQR